MKYYFFIQSGAFGLYTDLYNHKDVKFYSTDQLLNPDFLTSIPLFWAKGFDKLIKTNFKKLLDYTHIAPTKDMCFIIESGFLRRMDAVYLKKIKHSNAKLCLLLIDAFRGGSMDLILAKERIFSINWNQVYTFDRADSDHYGWTYIGLNYYSRPRILSKATTSDAYFVGGLKGNRDALIMELFHKLKSKSNPLFDVYCINHEQYEKREILNGLNYSMEWQSYKKILKKVAATNCIIEILQENQTAQTLRYFEAIAFNKKLLTNNKNIINLPFYDEKYMRYFETADDVDLDWVRKKEDIDYHYNDEFSPMKLFEQIRGDIENI